MSSLIYDFLWINKIIINYKLYNLLYINYNYLRHRNHHNDTKYDQTFDNTIKNDQK